MEEVSHSKFDQQQTGGYDIIRKDRFGNIIDGSRRHKIAFKDKVGQGTLSTIHEVASYKKFNAMDEHDDPDDANYKCKCVIF